MTAANWNDWFVRSFDNCISSHMEAINRNFGDIVKAMDENVNDTDAALDDIVEGAFGRVVGLHHKKIFELLEIVQVLAVGNDFLSGRIDQISREFKHKQEASKTIERTIATTTEEERRVSQTTLSILGEVLHG